MPKCLIITSRNPMKLYGGDINRLEALVCHLSKKFSVEIIVTDGQQNKTLEKVNFRGNVVTIHLISNRIYLKLFGLIWAIKNRFTLQSGIFCHPFIQASVSKTISQRNYNVIVFHLFRTFFEVGKLYKGKVHIDLCDAQSKTYSTQRLASGKNLFYKYLFSYEHARTIETERKLLGLKNISFSLINKTDLEYLKSSNNIESEIFILPNAFKITAVTNKNRVINRIAVVGNFYANHNRAMLDELFMHHGSLLKNSPIKIVGQIKQQYLDSLPPELVYAHKDPKRVTDHILDCEYGLCVLPFGAGFQTKLIDYANAGLVPIVSQNVADGAGLVQNKSCVILDDMRNLESCLNFSHEVKNAIAQEFRNTLKMLSDESTVRWESFMRDI